MAMVKEEIGLETFVVEANGIRNNDILIQSIPGCKLRGRINSNRRTLVNLQDRGTPVVPPDQVRFLGQLPDDIPGMMLKVIPSKRTVVIIDPLNENEELSKKITESLSRMERIGSRVEIRGVPNRTEVLDEDRFKTFLREVIQIVEAGFMEVVKGTLPTIEQVNNLPGDYLLNPGSRVHTTQPKYEKDLESWTRNLNKVS